MSKTKGKKPIGKIIIAIILIIAVVAAVAVIKRNKGTSVSTDYMTDYAYYGSIVSTVEGSGVAVPKNSASISILTSGTVNEVFVAEGDFVYAGDPLYKMDSTEAEKQLESAKRYVNTCEKNLQELEEVSGDLNIRAEHDGLLMNVTRFKEGDTIIKGQSIATLVDDNTMLLSLYFSYAYENDIYVGQKAEISIPDRTQVLEGTVKEIHLVKKITKEGGALFEVVFSMKNPGLLTEGLEATASIDLGTETAYPYESGSLEYNDTYNVTATASGKVASCNIYEYSVVKKGDSLIKLTADSNEDEIAAAEATLKSAQKQLEEAQKYMNSVDATAPIDGTVLSVGVTEGEEATVGTIAVSIADTSKMVVNTSIDERNVSYVKQGMMVEVDQWGTYTTGIITSVSLTGSYSSGVSTFPITIELDNSEGSLMSGSYVSFSFTASQSDNCLVIPVQAVKYATVEGERKSVVFVRFDYEPENAIILDEGSADYPEGFYPVEVEVGLSDNSNAEIKSGLEEGQEVFTTYIMSSSDLW